MTTVTVPVATEKAIIGPRRTYKHVVMPSKDVNSYSLDKRNFMEEKKDLEVLQPYLTTIRTAFKWVIGCYPKWRVV